MGWTILGQQMHNYIKVENILYSSRPGCTNLIRWVLCMRLRSSLQVRAVPLYPQHSGQVRWLGPTILARSDRA